MGARIPGSLSSSLANALPANATETVICITPSIILAVDSQLVMIGVTVGLLVGTGTTSITLTLRRGNLVSSPSVGAGIAKNVTAGNNDLLTLLGLDGPGVIGTTPYCVTIIQTGATAAGTVNALVLFALPF